MPILPEMDLLKIQTITADQTAATFVIEPLLPGYGVTLGNALRRVLLSSLPGAAFTTLRINNVSHEFSTLPGVTEDVIAIIMNLKQVRIKLHGDEQVTLKLSAKGPKQVSAADFEKNAQVEIMTPLQSIAHLDKKGQLQIEARVERGRGYLPTEQRKDEKLPLGTIAIDAIFTPIRKVNFVVENTRVGQATNFDKLTIEVTTDGTLNPTQAIKLSAEVLKEYFAMVESIELPEIKVTAPKKTRVTTKPAKKTKAKSVAKK